MLTEQLKDGGVRKEGEMGVGVRAETGSAARGMLLMPVGLALGKDDNLD